MNITISRNYSESCSARLHTNGVYMELKWNDGQLLVN